MSSRDPFSPLGTPAEDAAARRLAESERYRAQHDRLAPYRAIAKAIILARADTGWTQKRLAEAIGTTDSAISRVESGRHPISLETLTKLGSVLDIAFVVGSASATQHLAGDKRCVVIPEAAIDTSATRPAGPRARFASTTPVGSTTAPTVRSSESRSSRRGARVSGSTACRSGPMSPG
jgi:transcriptional regulator with XRE-family HTH domain